MGRCSGSSGCACVVTGDDPIEVTGDGSVETPYVVGLADAVATSLEVDDTATVDLHLVGTGAPGSPYELTADVTPGTVTPATNPTLDLVGAKVGTGLTYDGGTRETGIDISADEPNAVAFGTDDGLFVPDRSWVIAVVDTTGPLVVDVTAGPQNQPAFAAPGYTPDVGDQVYALPGATGYLLLGVAP